MSLGAEEGELLALASKMRELLALRALGDREPPRDRIRALATRFPGALRELDRLTVETLEARWDALTAALDGGPVPSWAVPMSRLHGWLRVGLRLRAEAARTEEAAVVWAAAYEPVFAGDPPRARLARDVLAELVRPREGRLVRVAMRLAAEDAGTTLLAVEALLSGR